MRSTTRHPVYSNTLLTSLNSRANISGTRGADQWHAHTTSNASACPSQSQSWQLRVRLGDALKSVRSASIAPPASALCRPRVEGNDIENAPVGRKGAAGAIQIQISHVTESDGMHCPRGTESAASLSDREFKLSAEIEDGETYKVGQVSRLAVDGATFIANLLALDRTLTTTTATIMSFWTSRIPRVRRQHFLIGRRAVV